LRTISSTEQSAAFWVAVLVPLPATSTLPRTPLWGGRC